MATVHLISGLPCSGKTTYSKKLAQATGGVHFWLDFWLISLYGRYSIEDVGHNEHVRRVIACREMIWHVAAEFLKRGTDVILDDGFFLRGHRREYVKRGLDLGVAASIHYLDTPVDVMRKRLAERNARLPKYNFPILPERFEMFLSMYEPPSASEGAELVVVK